MNLDPLEPFGICSKEAAGRIVCFLKGSLSEAFHQTIGEMGLYVFLEHNGSVDLAEFTNLAVGYHATERANHENIIRHGLRLGDGASPKWKTAGKVYFSRALGTDNKEEGTSRKWADLKDLNDPCFYRVDLAGIPLREDSESMLSRNGDPMGALFATIPIAPERLTHLDI